MDSKTVTLIFIWKSNWDGDVEWYRHVILDPFIDLQHQILLC